MMIKHWEYRTSDGKWHRLPATSESAREIVEVRKDLTPEDFDKMFRMVEV